MRHTAPKVFHLSHVSGSCTAGKIPERQECALTDSERHAIRFVTLIIQTDSTVALWSPHPDGHVRHAICLQATEQRKAHGMLEVPSLWPCYPVLEERLDWL